MSSGTREFFSRHIGPFYPPPDFRPRGSRIRPERHNPRSITTLRMVLARYLFGGIAQCPFCGVALRLILGIDICLHHASRWARVVRGGLPGVVHQLYPAQLLENHARPIFRRSDRPQSALTLASILITEHAWLAQAIAAQ